MYQFTVPVLDVAPKVTEPLIQTVALVVPVIVGIVFIVACTGVLVAVVQLPRVAST